MRSSIRSMHFSLSRTRVGLQIAITSWEASKVLSLRRMLHAIRANLFASAVASLLRCSRGAAFCSHAPKLKRCQLWGRIRMTFAAWMNRVLRYLLPRLEMRPRMDRPLCAVLAWHEAKPCAEVSPALECLTSADGGHHGGRDQRADTGHAREAPAVGFLVADLLDLARKGLDPFIETNPVFVQTSNQAAHSSRYLVSPLL